MVSILLHSLSHNQISCLKFNWSATAELLINPLCDTFGTCPSCEIFQHSPRAALWWAAAQSLSPLILDTRACIIKTTQWFTRLCWEHLYNPNEATRAKEPPRSHVPEINAMHSQADCKVRKLRTVVDIPASCFLQWNYLRCSIWTVSAATDQVLWYSTGWVNWIHILYLRSLSRLLLDISSDQRQTVINPVAFNIMFITFNQGPAPPPHSPTPTKSEYTAVFSSK